MKIQISDHFNYNRLIRFTVPSIVMIVFSSVYNVVDGYFEKMKALYFEYNKLYVTMFMKKCSNEKWRK